MYYYLLRFKYYANQLKCVPSFTFQAAPATQEFPEVWTAIE
jgi:hypothetical protein